MQELIDRLRGALAERGLQRAVLSDPETLAHLEHTFVVRSGGNEILTRFEHTL